jgi:hypothetical protein
MISESSGFFCARDERDALLFLRRGELARANRVPVPCIHELSVNAGGRRIAAASWSAAVQKLATALNPANLLRLVLRTQSSA